MNIILNLATWTAVMALIMSMSLVVKLLDKDKYASSFDYKSDNLLGMVLQFLFRVRQPILVKVFFTIVAVCYTIMSAFIGFFGLYHVIVSAAGLDFILSWYESVFEFIANS